MQSGPHILIRYLKRPGRGFTAGAVRFQDTIDGNHPSA